ncbi:MAG: hypothetical protein NVS1B11_06400 [Terriglobales bacterium]
MNGAALNWYPIAEASASRIVNGTLEGIVIAAVAAILLRTLRGQNSSTRFAICFASLIAITMVPFSGLVSAHAAMSSSPAWEVIVPSSWAIYFFAGWAVISTIALARLVFGMLRLQQMRRRSLPLSTSSLDPLLKKTVEQFARGRRVALRVSDEVAVPAALGFMSPTVVLPSWAVQELSSTELNAILLHELAHLRRRDDWTNLAQKILRAVFFFHPAVWWLENRLTIEREIACDDAVLAQTANPRGYAQCLVSLAEKRLARHRIALAQAIIGRVQQTSRRVRQILDLKRTPSTKVWKPLFGTVAAALLATVALMSRMPQVFAFQDATAPRFASAQQSRLSPRAVNYEEPVKIAGKSDFATQSSVQRKVMAVARRSQSLPLATPKAEIVMASAVKPGSPATKSARKIPVTERSVMEASLVPRRLRAQATSSANLESSGGVRSSTLFFITEARYNEAGSAILNFAVWEITTYSPKTPKPITPAGESRIPAKKI